MKQTLFCVLLFCTTSATTFAGPILFVGTGNYYEAFTPVGGITWADAKTATESMTFGGVSGHLATIHSIPENDFVRDLAVAARAAQGDFYKEFWLGGFQPDGSLEPAADWQWVTGETWSYTKWDPPGPDNNTLHGEQDSLEMLISPVYNVGTWQDVAGGAFPETYGYVVEFTGAAVPEPSSFLMFSIGAVGFCCQRRIKKRNSETSRTSPHPGPHRGSQIHRRSQ
jgi:hypothetical protein